MTAFPSQAQWDREFYLKIALTGPEKKVIGFVVLLLVLGLAVLGFRRWLV